MATDRLKEKFVIACEVEVFPTGTRVAQFPKTFVAERCLNKQKAFVKIFDTVEGVKRFSKHSTYQKFSRRNPKVVSKVPVKGVRFGKRRKRHLNASGAYVLKVKSGKLCAGVCRRDC